MCDDSPNLRDFRKQKKPAFSHASSNRNLNVSTAPSESSSINSTPTRRRIVQLSDSDSDSDSGTVYNNGVHTQSLIVEKPQQIQGPSTNKNKSEKVLERERQVRYLIKTFPTITSFVIYDILSSVDFDLERAIQELQANVGSKTEIVDYKTWQKTEAPVKKHCIVAVKRDWSETRNYNNSKPQKSGKHKRRKVARDDDGCDSSYEEYKTNKVFDSDEDSDVEITNELTGDKKRVLEFLQKSTPNELSLMANCSKKKVDAIIACRPFQGWVDLVDKLQSNKNLNTDLLNAAQRVLITRNNIKQLMKKCTNIAKHLEQVVKNANNLKLQPSNLTPTMRLTNYQMVGLNWLIVLFQEGVNGILADEMGLGKTVQVIAFLAYLKEMKAAKTTHLVVVPASTLENWQNEFVRWCPEMRVLLYYGNADERRGYRIMFSEGKHKEFDVILTTYAMVSSSPEERKMFRVTPMHYVVFDEAHMLKNMNTQRFETLARIKASKRLLLTGTPLQNNLLELMSLLIFVMPNIFSEKTEDLKSLFQKNNKKDKENEDIPTFEKDQIEQAKQIMKPFVLRRLKNDVLQDLPKKSDFKLEIPMAPTQDEQYHQLVTDFQNTGKNVAEGGISGMTMMSDLRKLANHPLLLRYHYLYEDLPKLAKRLAADPNYKDTVEKYIIDDLACMSDFEIHTMCKEYNCLKKFILPDKLITISGKFMYLDKKLEELKQGGHRVVIFSQYVIMLNILEEYLSIRNHSFLRLDGSTPVTIRQQLIDEFTEDPDIFIFLLSTRAGGLGINLTAANTVIIHDIDFNPYNDKQAEDRCHRMGQTKPVSVFRLISKDTIEEGMWALTQEKLKLEKEITSEDFENTDVKSVVSLLSSALNMDINKVASIVSPTKS